MRDVVMAVFGLSHTINTKVGNDFIRGISGGERKRVSIAEAALGGSPIQCWDNSTRGLDSATALEFVKTLRISTSLAGSTAIVAIYQASQAIYDVCDTMFFSQDPADRDRSSTRLLCFTRADKYTSATSTRRRNSSSILALIALSGKQLPTFSHL